MKWIEMKWQSNKFDLFALFLVLISFHFLNEINLDFVINFHMNASKFFLSLSLRRLSIFQADEVFLFTLSIQKIKLKEKRKHDNFLLDNLRFCGQLWPEVSMSRANRGTCEGKIQCYVKRIGRSVGGGRKFIEMIYLDTASTAYLSFYRPVKSGKPASVRLPLYTQLNGC